VHADYPADNDAAVLYVESVFDTGDIDWNAGKPTPDAALVAGILEGVLKREPGHVGANHFYVHACDFIGVAERALPSARRLSALPAEPAASHLVHMSGHIYLDLGMFEDLERDNRTAVDDDRAFALSSGAADPWNLDYFGHNLDFYLGGATMLGDRPNIDRALDIARTGQGRGSYGLALARRRDWDGVLAWPQAPSAPLWQRLIATYARGLASSERGDAAQARAAEAALEAGRATPGFTGGVATNLADLLGARLAHAAGDDDDALTRLRRVQAAVQPLPPEVFAPWYFPVGEWIGSILLARGDAAGAEAAYRADLQRTPNNARALYGLMQSLSRQQRTAEARPLAAQIAANWRGTYEDLRPSF
jgi:tetratricopeptide (TPR) repeat protein